MQRLLVLSLLVLGGCGEKPVDPVAAAKVDRQRVNSERLSAVPAPVPRTYRFDGNELKVFEVPTAAGRTYVETQRCFVWRDLELRTAAISCSGSSDEPATEHPR